MRCWARRACALLVGIVVVAGLVAVLGVTGTGRALAQAAGGPPLEQLLPLARGQLEVSVGPPGQWLPESGIPTGVTLLSGLPRKARLAADNAYLALQAVNRRCARTVAADRVTPIVIPAYYAARNLISEQRASPYAGAQAGDYAVGLSRIVIHQTGEVRACVWLARREKSRGLALDQVIRLLNGQFAASVSMLPSASPGVGGAYTLDAIDVGEPFSYAVRTLQCNDQYQDASSTAPDGLATESIAIETNPCAGDGSTFTFRTAGGRALASLTYTEAQATATTPEVSTVGSCELDPVAVVPLVDAADYLQAVGCPVARLLIAPYKSSLPLGAVVEAQVDGGLAEVAPTGTPVDLELNGRPSTSSTATRHRHR